MSTEDPAAAIPGGPVERQIREAIERGEFDALPGAGKPLPDIDSQYDPAWWARRWVETTRRQEAADELRRMIRAEVPRLEAAPDREAAARRVAELNGMIAEANEFLGESERIPPVTL